jgi:hypothetical protein
MIRAAVLLVVSSATLLGQSLLGQPWQDDRAQICFDRPENNGMMNIHESWVHALNYRVRLIGGQAVCLFTEPGSVEVVVTSTVPYKPSSTNQWACKSRVIQLELKAREKREFMIWPAAKGPTYVCGWRLQPVANP